MTDEMMDTICEMESADFPRYEPSEEINPTPRVTRVTRITRMNGRLVGSGRLVSFVGQRGRFKFRDRRINPETGVDEINVWGPIGRGRRAAFRTFHAHDLRTVHNEVA